MSIPMIIPARGKVLVEVYSQKNTRIYLPETASKPKSSVAEIINGNGNFPKGQLVLIPTRAGLVIITEHGIKQRLINDLDIMAVIEEGEE